jgi:hypothetical protein
MKKLIAFFVILAPLFITEISFGQSLNWLNWMDNSRQSQDYYIQNPDRVPLLVGTWFVPSQPSNSDPGILLDITKSLNCDPGILLPAMNFDYIDPGILWPQNSMPYQYKFEKPAEPRLLPDLRKKLYPNSLNWPDIFSNPNYPMLPQRLDLMEKPLLHDYFPTTATFPTEKTLPK